MNRQIKFRGRRVKDGGFVYGDYCVGLHGYPSIRDHETKQYVDVNPDTVAQFIGYDSHGNEVYEGDPIKLADGWRCTATFRHFGAIVDGDATLITEE